jgi:hypothetical protein
MLTSIQALSSIGQKLADAFCTGDTILEDFDKDTFLLSIADDYRVMQANRENQSLGYIIETGQMLYEEYRGTDKWKDILSKPIDQISQVEFCMLALIYWDLSVEEMQEFARLLGGPGKSGGGFPVWNMNKEKIEGIQVYMNVYINTVYTEEMNLRALIKAMRDDEEFAVSFREEFREKYGNASDDALNAALEAHLDQLTYDRGDLLQRNALLTALGNLTSYSPHDKDPTGADMKYTFGHGVKNHTPIWITRQNVDKEGYCDYVLIYYEPVPVINFREDAGPGFKERTITIRRTQPSFQIPEELGGVLRGYFHGTTYDITQNVTESGRRYGV